jgi:hypothetical protein
VLWDLVRGATRLQQPLPSELATRYTELLADNLGQPGFRELFLAVHDLDARRDLIFSLVPEARRRALIRRTTTEQAEERRAEVFDLSGVARDRLVDAVAGALAVPLLCEPRRVDFPADGYWRGETHRLCDRPGALARLIHELSACGTEQIIVVSPAPEPDGPHTLAPPRLDGRGRAGDYLRSQETAVLRDVLAMADASVSLYVIRPVHNPIGPFDFSGGIDHRSDRRQPLGELIARGYEDSYRQFIEPVVGASGERVGLV